MGQRHQLSIKAPASVLQYTPGERKPDTLMSAWHNQWLYGTLPIKTLKRLLYFDHNNTSNSKWEGSTINEPDGMVKFKNTVKAIMEFDYDDQKFSKFHDEGDYLIKDYRAGDNNDGLTFLVFTDGRKPRYGFMTGSETGGNSMEKGHIVSVREYFSAYYPDVGALNLKQQEEATALFDYIENRADLLSDLEIPALFPEMKKKPEPWPDEPGIDNSKPF